MKNKIKLKLKSVCYGVFTLLSLSASYQVIAATAGPQPTYCQNGQNQSGKDSSCLPSAFGGLATTPPTKDFEADAIKPFAKVGKSCVTPWGATIPDNTSIDAFFKPVGTYDAATGQYAADCVEESRHCSDGTLDGSYQYQSCTMGTINGSCGSANGVVYTYPSSGPPASQQCNPQYTYGGVPPANDTDPPSVPASSGAFLTNNTYTWTCAGEFGGASASCYAYRKLDGQCGGSTFSCNAGNMSNAVATPVYEEVMGCYDVVTETEGGSWTQTFCDVVSYNFLYTTYSWSCGGANGGANASCSVNLP